MRMTFLRTTALAIILAMGMFKLTDLGGGSDIKLIPPEVHEAFAAWRSKELRFYGSPVEEAYRLSIFYENYKFVKETNLKQDSYKVAINQFSDMTDEEFEAKYTGEAPEDSIGPLGGSTRELCKDLLSTSYPDKVDWVAAGAMTPVQNQGSCGSCWAFASTAAFEFAYWYYTREGEEDKTKKITPYKFSEQMLMDCDTERSGGCDGGYPAYKFLSEEGIIKEKYAKYKGRQGPCNYSIKPRKATDYTYCKKLTKEQMMAAISQAAGQVSVKTNSVFKSYSSGIITDNCVGTESTSHAVFGVGYGVDKNGDPYLRIKNSWRERWGEGGYASISMKACPKGVIGLGSNNILKKYMGIRYKTEIPK